MSLFLQGRRLPTPADADERHPYTANPAACGLSQLERDLE
jgi:hypothetical protein